jgi:ABC-type amino acid transport substrate-binding protein
MYHQACLSWLQSAVPDIMQSTIRFAVLMLFCFGMCSTFLSCCCRLQQAVARASKKIQQGSDKLALASSLKMVSAGVEMVFGSAAAISAAFGYTDRVGLDVELLEQTQQSILQLFSAEE